jgi:hypothetical protein
MKTGKQIDISGIPDRIFELVMLRLICTKLNISEPEIHEMAVDCYKKSKR